MVILITGISSGFGKAMAEALSAEGHKVYGTHRHAREFIPGVEYIKADEYVEVTPKSMRMRKVILDELERKRANRKD